MYRKRFYFDYCRIVPKRDEVVCQCLIIRPKPDIDTCKRTCNVTHNIIKIVRMNAMTTIIM